MYFKYNSPIKVSVRRIDILRELILPDGTDGGGDHQRREHQIAHGGRAQLVHPPARADVHRQIVLVCGELDLDGLVHPGKLFPAVGLAGLDEVDVFRLGHTLCLHIFLETKVILQLPGHVGQGERPQPVYFCVCHAGTSILL